MKIHLPENINLADAERCILTLRIHPEHFSFSVYSPVEDASYFYHSIEQKRQSSAFAAFQDAFFDNELFSLNYRQIYIINHTPVFAYIPSLIFEERDKEVYHNFLFTEKSGRLLHHQLANQDITIIHKMQEEVYNFCMRSFVNARIIHHTAPLITFFRSKSQTINRNRLIVNIQQNSMDVLCFAQETLLLGNHFIYSNKVDAAYYIHYIWRQLKFNQLADFLYIAGDADSKKNLIERLKTYYQNIIPVNIIPEAHFERIDTQAIPFEISCLSLCEL